MVENFLIHVFLMLDNFNPDNNEKKRQLYVAMTRAKLNLSIHLNGNYLDDIPMERIKRDFDRKSYSSADLLILHLSHKDIWLDYFISIQRQISNLKCGDCLVVDKEGCVTDNGSYIVKFSNRLKDSLDEHESKGYRLKSAAINYIVYWQKEDSENEVKIILPELRLEKE